MIKIRVKAIREGARLPIRASAGSAGADLCCLEPFVLTAGERRGVPTGLTVEVPLGYYGRVAPRSGLAARHAIDVLAGVIDSDYRGELIILLINLGTESVSFKAGDRIAQLIIENAAPSTFEFADDLSDTTRGDGGFGSSGT